MVSRTNYLCILILFFVAVVMPQPGPRRPGPGRPGGPRGGPRGGPGGFGGTSFKPGEKIDVQQLIKQSQEKKKQDDDFKEYTKIEEYKNPKLWACDLLANCRLLAERVFFSNHNVLDPF